MRSVTKGGSLVAFLCVAVLVLLLLSHSPALAASSFSDVPDTHPYAPAIIDLKGRGIVSGFADGTFRPNSQMTRQQFAKVIVKTLGLTVTGLESCPFGDVSRGLSPGDPLYPDKYVAVCAAAGITTGKTPSAFDPTGSVTRAQLITMVARAADLTEPPSAYNPSFGNFDPAHYPWARKAAYAGLLDGLQGMGPSFDFFAPATRGEVAEVLVGHYAVWRGLFHDQSRLAKSSSGSSKPPAVISSDAICRGRGPRGGRSLPPNSRRRPPRASTTSSGSRTPTTISALVTASRLGRRMPRKPCAPSRGSVFPPPPLSTTRSTIPPRTGSEIDAYFRGIASVVPVSQMGVYGNYTTIDWLYENGLATYFCQSNAWPQPQGWHPQAQMRQDVTSLWIGGVHCDRLTVTAADFGQCRRREQSDPRLHYTGTWSAIGQTLASGGSYGRSSAPGASITVYFRGTRLDWLAVKGFTPGVADVYLDGMKKATIDLAAPASTYQVGVWSTGTLPEGDHMVEIVRSASSMEGEYLTVDALDIWGTVKTGT